MISKPQELSGILVAIITPFTDDGKHVDSDRFKSHIDHIIDAGCHGLVPGGSTGEFTALTTAERKESLEMCIKHANGRVPVIAGIGHTSTTEVLDLAAHAASAGAAALMVVPPYYDPLNYEQVCELMDAVSGAANGLPIVYYNIPSASGANLSPSEIAGLSDHGVKYLKDTSGNGPALTELLFSSKHTSKITAFNGWDTLTFYGLAAGAKGSVWGASNIIPELSAQLWETVAVNKDLEKGRKLWAEQIWPLCAFLESVNYSSAIKTAMELLGTKTGGVRKPFTLLQGEKRKELAQVMRDCGLKVVE